MALEGDFGEVPKALRPVLETAQRKTEEAKALAAELLTVARLEGKALTPKVKSVSVAEAVREALARARPRAEIVKANVQMEPGDDVTVLADEALVGKILDNLLNNALTYADRPPTIRVGASREGEQVAVSVADDGIGISPQDQGRIFARFARGTDPLVAEKPGNGLGLYLSRGLAEQIGGSLQLRSSHPGKGSTFVLRLPAVAS
ncbi:MAG: HAMP domain-containing histidine kinase [Chloroflexi bacterium]|nr:MAG: HAMP domain-containing histidine kinase [Chloroflexota bacterium]